MKRSKPMKRSPMKRGTSAQSKRTKLKRWGPPGYRSLVESRACCVGNSYCSGPIDAAHLVPRSRLGGWEDNLVPLCRFHHSALDITLNNDVTKFDYRYGTDLRGTAKDLTTVWKMLA